MRLAIGKLILIIGIVTGGVVVSLFVHPVSAQETTCGSTSICNIESVLSLEAKLGSASPEIATPAWVSTVKTFTYSIETRGVITADLAEFKAQVDETLNSDSGWVGLGAWFKHVDTGGAFVVVLAEASKVPLFAPGLCSDELSCRVGKYVIINQDRWLGATKPWNDAAGSLRDYRNMVVNHEVGHWLGHPHEDCGGTGQLAPVMRQQSVDLQGCKFNPWPLDSELWTNKS